MLKLKSSSRQMRPVALQDMLTAITRATSLQDLNHVVSTLPQKGGLFHVVYHYLGVLGPKVADLPPGFATYPEEWVTRYLQQDYAQVDPVVRRGRESLLPFEWGEVTVESADQQKLLDEARDFDLGQAALSLPVRGVEGQNALFTITSTDPAAFAGPNRMAYVRDYQAIGVYLHEAFVRLAHVAQEAALELSQPERNCLKLAADGLLGKDIAHYLKLPEAAVRLYLRIARHKLAATCTGSAVTIARQQGLI